MCIHCPCKKTADCPIWSRHTAFAGVLWSSHRYAHTSGTYQCLCYREICLHHLKGSCVADLRTRSELLESTLPAPVMSTSPSGLNQAEEARPSHPENVQAFDVAPIVHAYLASLPATPERFKLPDAANLTVHRSTFCMQLAQCKCMSCYIDLI